VAECMCVFACVCMCVCVAAPFYKNYMVSRLCKCKFLCICFVLTFVCFSFSFINRIKEMKI
jgi:hypothetical protein